MYCTVLCCYSHGRWRGTPRFGVDGGGRVRHQPMLSEGPPQYSPRLLPRNNGDPVLFCDTTPQAPTRAWERRATLPQPRHQSCRGVLCHSRTSLIAFSDTSTLTTPTVNHAHSLITVHAAVTALSTVGTVSTVSTVPGKVCPLNVQGPEVLSTEEDRPGGGGSSDASCGGGRGGG